MTTSTSGHRPTPVANIMPYDRVLPFCRYLGLLSLPRDPEVTARSWSGLQEVSPNRSCLIQHGKLDCSHRIGSTTF